MLNNGISVHIFLTSFSWGFKIIFTNLHSNPLLCRGKSREAQELSQITDHMPVHTAQWSRTPVLSWCFQAQPCTVLHYFKPDLLEDEFFFLLLGLLLSASKQSKICLFLKSSKKSIILISLYKLYIWLSLYIILYI